ncbi:uncharacterized protein LOC123274021 [Cotesia glomerata]|nr:uncharacterized protein LOC123274021 [Cotesia glomerata]
MGSDRCHKLMWGKPVNNVSEVTNKSILKSSNIPLSITSHATLNDEGYVFTHHFPTLGDISMQYYALDFVPDDYAIIWSCEPRGNKHIEKAWVYSRNITLPHNIDALKREAFQRYNLPMPKMIRHDHSDCDEVFSSFNF